MRNSTIAKMRKEYEASWKSRHQTRSGLSKLLDFFGSGATHFSLCKSESCQNNPWFAKSLIISLWIVV